MSQVLSLLVPYVHSEYEFLFVEYATHLIYQELFLLKKFLISYINYFPY